MVEPPRAAGVPFPDLDHQHFMRRAIAEAQFVPALPFGAVLVHGPTAKEMAEDLERFVKDEPIWARRPSIWKRVRGWGRRHKALVTAGGAVLGTFLVLAGVAIWRG